MDGRIKGLLESTVFVVLFCLIYWIIGFFIKKTFNKEIRNSFGYTVCIVLGFVSKRFLIIIFQ